MDLLNQTTSMIELIKRFLFSIIIMFFIMIIVPFAVITIFFALLTLVVFSILLVFGTEIDQQSKIIVWFNGLL